MFGQAGEFLAASPMPLTKIPQEIVAMNPQVQQAYDVWKKSTAEFIAEMDNVMAGQDPGGRLTSVTASMEFAYQMFNTLYQEELEAND